MAKIVGSCIYVHKSNVVDLLRRIDNSDYVECYLDWFMNELNNMEVNYEVIKYDKTNNKLSLIDSPDWIVSYEPKVGDSWVLNLNTLKWKHIPKRRKNPQIYHSKELFVSDDYKGFDIEKAKERTKLWKSLPNLDTKRIGNYDFWVEFLNANGMEV